ncbi:MAG TPA: group II truncated hemoglobin [Candidatus Polarisedimenticolia bacterium]|jgi:hemoglobin|nr:group II truncated hemoglobin [Candidatus Polarisedimenticolia bacterium]
MTGKFPPSPYDWAGGMPALERLMTRFYEHVAADPLLRDVFARVGPGHAHLVAQFIAEVLGGPRHYSEAQGGHPHMIQQHLNRQLTQVQRRRWMDLLLATADEVGLPDDPEFRSALVGYLEWGSRLAVLNSQPGAQADPHAPMPRWGWGVPGGPYEAKKEE